MKSPHAPNFEVIVIGAGAAGLAAAHALARAGRKVLLLEARERIGGRVWTRSFPGLDVPVELGAEFVHGRAAATRRLLRASRAAATPSGRQQRYLDGNRLRPIDAFAEAKRAMRERALLKSSDMSFERFLRSQSRLPARTRTFARLMVQGFDAADPALASARAIAEEWAGGDALLGEQPRPSRGYAPLLDWLAREFVSRGGRLRMEATVREVHWSPGAVRVRGAGFDFAARKAVVSLPLGVLQSGSVSFRPALGKKEALGALASGPVVKGALRFPSAFWEKRHRGVAFFHAPGAPFPTFWTPLPARVPVLIAWAGGPKAERLAGRGSARLLSAMLSSLQAMFGDIPQPDHALVHDWLADPHAGGAYSYVKVNGDGAREALAASMAGTLFFAGEATNLQGESGTVSGALQTGQRAAREALTD